MGPIQITLLILGVSLVVAVAAFLAGTIYRKKVAEREIGSAEEEATRIINEAIRGGESKKKEMLLEAKDELHKSRTEYEKEVKERRSELSKQERRLQQKEESLDKKMDAYERKEDDLTKKQAAITATQNEVNLIKRSQMEVLEKISGLTQEEANSQRSPSHPQILFAPLPEQASAAANSPAGQDGAGKHCPPHGCRSRRFPKIQSRTLPPPAVPVPPLRPASLSPDLHLHSIRAGRSPAKRGGTGI